MFSLYVSRYTKPRGTLLGNDAINSSLHFLVCIFLDRLCGSLIIFYYYTFHYLHVAYILTSTVLEFNRTRVRSRENSVTIRKRVRLHIKRIEIFGCGKKDYLWKMKGINYHSKEECHLRLW